MRKRRNEAAIPEPGEGKRGEDGYLGYLLRQAAAAYRHGLERAFVDLAVTPPQFTVLTMLKAYPGLSGAEIARLALLTPQTVSVIVANLERAGWIERRPHAVHGRVLQLDLTESGSALLAQCRERVRTIEAEVGADLSPDENQIIRRWLVRVAKIYASEPS